MRIEGWAPTKIGDFAWEPSERATPDAEVLSVTKHRGFVPSLEYFGKQVFSKVTDNYKLVRKGQFAYATIHLDEGSIDCLTIREQGIISPMYTVFDVDERRVDRGFLLDLLRTPAMLERYAAIGQGSINRRKSIGFEALASEIVLLPPLPEQQKIAAILSSVDEAIQATQAVIDQTRRVKEGLLQDLLTRGLPGHTRFKQTEIGEIPEGWEVRRVGNALSIENSKRKPIKQDERAMMPGPYPYWGPTKIQDHIAEYSYDGEFALVGEDGDHFLKWKTWEMTQWATGRFNVNNHAHVLASTSTCHARWFFYFFLHRDLGDTLTRQGAGRYKLTKAALQSMLIAVPSLKEQQQIIEIMDAAREPDSRGSDALRGLHQLKAGLLQDLLTGKVRVTP